MITLNEITLKNVVVFEEASLPLDKYPLVVVRGRNRDRKVEGSSNACGKTLLYSTPRNILCGGLAQSIRKKNERELLGVNSSISLELTKRKHNYEISQTSKAKSTIYSIKDNGIDITPDRAKVEDSRNLISGLVGLEDWFYDSFVHIDGRIPCHLQMARSPERFEFFQNLFHLNIFSDIGSAVARRVNEFRRNRQQYETIKAQLESIPKPVKVDLESDQELEQRLSQELRELQRKLLKAEQFELLYKKVIPLSDKDADYDPLDFDDHYEETKKALKELEAQMTLSEANAEVGDKIKTLKKDIRAYREKWGTHAKPKNYSERLESIAFQLKNQKQKLEGMEEPIDETWYEAFDFKGKIHSDWATETLNKLYYEYKDIESSLNDVLDVLKHWQGDDTHKCPTCATRLNKETLKKMKVNLESQRDALKEGISKKLLEKRALIVKQNKTLVADRRALEEVIEKKRTKLRNMKAEQARFEEFEEDTAVYEKKKNRLESLMERYEEIPFNQDEYERVQEHMAHLESIKPLIDAGFGKMLTFSDEELKRRLKALRDQNAELTAELDEVQDRLNKNRSTHAKSQERRTLRSTLKSQLEELDSKAVNEEALDSLRSLFSAKGQRQAVQEFADSYIKNLNAFAPYLFLEPMTFKAELDDNNFHILASRNKGIADIRRLSGQESRAFCLLNLISLLSFVPRHQRCNLLVLDEIQANMDKPSRELLVQEFLPRLTSTVKNIVVIAPEDKETFYIEDAKELIIEKHKGVSQLIWGK